MNKEERLGFLIAISLVLLAIGGVVVFKDARLANNEDLSFAEDIKPLIIKRCAPCHTGSYRMLPNFIKYKKAFMYRSSIRERVWVLRTMPLSGKMEESERKTIKDWVDQGGKK